MKKKKLAFRPAKDSLNDTQLKALGFERCTEKRVRHPDEALPITFKTSQLIDIPRMESVRPGADDHLQVNRKGVRC